eukprot:scaffold261844_cov18-Tisochrysis_lutea.AAC.1
MGRSLKNGSSCQITGGVENQTGISLVAKVFNVPKALFIIMRVQQAANSAHDFQRSRSPHTQISRS